VTPRPRILHWSTVAAAKELMRQGKTLQQAAAAIGEDRAELDLSLWRQLGRKFA
jgi:hypothetical protein